MKRSRFLWLGSLLLVAITLALTACPGPTAPKTGSLKVITEPGTVEWTIAGPADPAAGITPTEKFVGEKTLTDLKPGDYTISGSLAGYDSGSVSAKVVADKTAEVTLKLVKTAATTGSLKVDVTPDTVVWTIAGPAAAAGINPTEKHTGDATLTDLAAGSYTVSGSLEGYDDGSASATVVAGQEASLALALSETVVPEPNPVANVTISGFKDFAGQAFVTRKEINASKNVRLLAAQLEDSVCFTVKVTDKDGDPIKGATVNIQPTSNLSGVRVVALSGCGANGTNPSAISTADLAFNKTDANGELKAYLVATYDGTSRMMYEDGGDPTVKVIVSAANETSDGVVTAGVNSAWNEFKVWFYNIAHLYRSEGKHKFTVTPARWGSSYDVIINNFVVGAKDGNAHAFGTRLMQKQPESKLFAPSDIMGGYIRYVLSGADKNRVEFDNCTNVAADGLSCNDTDGDILIKPKATETLQSVSDDPIDVEVSATLYFNVVYGVHKYSFALKNYTFKKRWVANFTKLEIDKVVDHHVLTWKGAAHTLAQQGSYTDPWIATYTITVKNAGKKIAKHVTITDAIQPELGWTGDATPAGATYDPALHQITWDIGDLAAGESRDVTFSVYARQKPGFCWQGGGFHTNRPPQAGSIEANGGCRSPYSDPYNAVNGEYKDDVTAEADDIDPVDFDPVGEGKVDQVILYVVRPLYQVDKFIKLPGGGTSNFITVKEDDNVDFGFKVTLVNRSTAEAEYAALEAKYPAEFGPASDPANAKWANPYGHTLTLVDWFDNGLDYDSGGIKVKWNPTSPKMVTMDGSDYTLIGNKAPAAFTGADYELHLTASEPTLDRNNDGVVDGWINCAYMDAGNLNQPAHDHGGNVALDWWDAHNQQHPWHVPANMHQITGVALGDPPHTASEPAAHSPNVGGNPGHPGFTITSPAGVDGDLEDCVVVYVNPREVSRILTLSTIKEHSATAAMASAAFAGAPETDPVAANSTFWYYFLVNAASTNTSSVDDIEFETQLFDGTYTGNFRVMEAASNGGQWPSFAWVDVANVPVVAGPVATFAEYDGLASDHYLLYAVEVTARANAGGESIRGRVTHSNAGNQADITPVVEQTIVQ